MVLVLISLEEGVVLRRLDVGPGIAGDDPACRRLGLQRIEIFGLAGQEADHRAVLKRAARVALAHELHEVAAELDIEDRVGLGGVDRFENRASVDLALRRPLLRHPLDVGALGGEQLLENCDGRLPIFIVRRDRRPSLGRKLGGFLRQHGRLHVIRGAKAEGVAVALGPGDRVGQRLAGDEQHLLLRRKIRDRESDIGEKGSGQQGNAVVRDKLVRRGHRVRRLAAVVLGNDDERLAIDAALGVDLLDGELPSLAIGLGKLRQA